MSGAGGNTVFLAPNGVTTFVFTDFGQDTYSLQSPAIAEAIAPYPGEGVGRVRLIHDGPDKLVVIAVIVAVVLLAGGSVMWFRRRRKAVSPQG
jgi:LPXTG-motif cell wall-anchored protein